MTDEELLRRIRGVQNNMRHDRKYKRTAQNPRPQQTTQYRIQKVADESLVTRVNGFEVAVRSRQLQESDRYTSEQYWQDGYSVPTMNGRSLT